MPDLVPCLSCEALVFSGTCTCPHCGRSACGPSGTRGGLGKAALAIGLVATLSACDGGENGDGPDSGVQALYGVALQDEDGDGYDASEDCDDSDPSVYPGADETPGDDVDSNCDGEDDT